MTKDDAIAIVIGVAAQWGENFEEQFIERIEADTSDERCAEIAEASDFEVDEVTEVRDLWLAIQTLRAGSER